MNLDHTKIAVIGLGYVGLPLAVAFGSLRPTLGFDTKEARIEQLKCGVDSTREVGTNELCAATHVAFSCDPAALADCGVLIVTVPTPIDRANRPDLTALCEATKTVGRAMKIGAVVIYESTVYPGCTRDVCVPILEAMSGLTFNIDFFVGYSPERANPGDREHRLATIAKVVSGSTLETVEAIERLYAAIVPAGIHKARTIEVAEAAKVIENTQRDLNIALMNEFAIIFDRLGIDTGEVLAAARTKWNFLPFTPGLVGGHCVGVDPYYLTYRAHEIGYHPEVILAGRRINDGMGSYVADRVVRLMMSRGRPVVGSRVLLMGLTFKENTPDTRNSKARDIARELMRLNAAVEIWDPWIAPEDCLAETDLAIVKEPALAAYDAVIVAVGHRQFVALRGSGVRAFAKPGAVVFDVKGVLPQSETDGRL